MRASHRSSRTHAAHPYFSHPVAVPSYGAETSSNGAAFIGSAAAALVSAAIGGAVQGVAYAYFLDAPIERGAKVGAAMTVALAAIGIGLAGIAGSVRVRPTAETPLAL